MSSGNMDLSGNVEPEQAMADRQRETEKLIERADENERDPGHDGEVTTEFGDDFSVDDALAALGDDTADAVGD